MKELLERLSFGFVRKTPLMLQTETTECGLACVGMIAAFHGQHTDLSTLRRRFPVSLKGVTLATLTRIASELGLVTRPLKLDMQHLGQLRLPCVLHWEFNHFIVLTEVRANSVTVLDPAYGERRLTRDEVDKGFTGVALELWPGADFRREESRQRVRLQDLIGHVTGLGRSVTQVLLLAGALEVFTIVAPLFQQWVVDDVIVSADRDLLSTLAIGFALLLFARVAVDALRGWVLMYIATMLNVQWRADVFTRMLQLPVAYFEKRHLGDVVSRFGSVEVIHRTLTTSFVEAILDGVMTVVTLGLMFIYSTTLTLIVIGTTVLYGVGQWIWFRPLRRATEDQIIHAAKQQSHFLETVRGIKIIKLFQRQDERRSSWLALLIEQINAELRTQKLNVLYRAMNNVLDGADNIVVIWLGARYVIDGHFTVGMLIAFLAYKLQFDTRVTALIEKFVSVKMLQIQGERLADIVFTAPEDRQGRELQRDTQSLPATVEVRNLCFRYAEQEPLVLDGLSFTIASGESVAIVGPSGVGKTTLVHILLGIFPPTQGEVLVAGLPICDLGLDPLRRMIGTVLQDDLLFAGSIADNISFFDPHADQAWIERCAVNAAIHEDIAAMPMGYNTLVGDMGTIMSGGQRQRILLARALYKRPRILILDEATSSLDADCERTVNAAVRSLNMTRLVVAHRPETIAGVDRVIELAAGGIVRDTPAIFQPAALKLAATAHAADPTGS